MHAHLSKARASSLGLFVANGVTTVRDMGGDYEELRQWRREVTAGTRLGPRILMPGPILESTANIARMRKDPRSRATRRPARFLRLGDSIGTVERGKIADLMLLDGDPLADIANIRRISAVVLRGQFHDRDSLDRIRAHVLVAADLQTDEWRRR